MKKRHIGIFVVLIGIGGGFGLAKGYVQQVIGLFYMRQLNKIRPSECIDGQKGFINIKPCFDKIKIKYIVLGDTVEGNFRVVLMKPFASASAEARNWELSAEGAGIHTTYQSQECYMEHNTKIPILSESEIQLLRKYADAWYTKNPEATHRFIEKVTDSDSELIVHSLPLEALKDYTLSCPEYFVFGHLDDRANTDLDVTVIPKYK
jgi:hypothetical protein